MGAGDGQRRFWDARAREDPYFFVDNRLTYGSPDLEAFWARGEHDLDTLLSAVGVDIRSTDRVVEIGCGVGRMTRALAARAADVRALDVSAEMLAIARRLHPDLANVTWLQGDGRSLRGIADASAGAVVSHAVFHHMPDPLATLGYIREIGRVLEPGGWAAFHFSNDPAAHRPRRLWRVRLRAALRRGPRGQYQPYWLGAAVDLDDLRAAAGAGGMAVERLENAGTAWCAALTRRPAPPARAGA